MNADSRERLLVVAAFCLIFAFTAVDSAISPMVHPLSGFFNVPLSQVLWLISACTAGIVVGVFLGPSLTNAYSVRRLTITAAWTLLVTLALFLSTRSFAIALGFRFLFGLAAGVIASVMWWITYHGVSQKSYQAMVTVLMASRPVAIAIGVPIASLIAGKSSWHLPYWLFAVLIFGSALFLFPSLRFEEPEKKPFSWQLLWQDYAKTFRLPYAKSYYLGLTINRCCYFGFYSFAGIWFFRHYGLSTATIGSLLLLVGLGEALVNFFVPTMLKWFGHERLFTGSLVASGVLFAAFISGRLPLPLALLLVTLFVILDRIYGMAMIIAIPQVFPASDNKSIFGSLTTLVAWIGLTAISWFLGRFTDSLGLPAMEWVLFGSFVVGSSLLYWVQARTVLRAPDLATN